MPQIGEIRRLIDHAYNEAREILVNNKDRLIQIAERLIAEETLEGEALEAVFNEAVPGPEPAKQPAEVKAPRRKPKAVKGDASDETAVSYG